MINALRSYFIGSLQELNQVRWPTRQQAVKLSIIVVCFIAVMTVVFGFVDYVLSAAVKFLLSLAV